MPDLIDKGGGGQYVCKCLMTLAPTQQDIASKLVTEQVKEFKWKPKYLLAFMTTETK